MKEKVSISIHSCLKFLLSFALRPWWKYFVGGFVKIPAAHFFSLANTDSILLTATLCGVEMEDNLLNPEVKEHFTYYPILLVKSTVALTDVLITWLQVWSVEIGKKFCHHFNSCISYLTSLNPWFSLVCETVC